jgi:hypothetical protein
LLFAMLFLCPRDTCLSSGAHGVVVSHPLRMRKALGSHPSVSTCRAAAGGKCGLPDCSRSGKAPRRFETRSLASESQVLTVAPRSQLSRPVLAPPAGSSGGAGGWAASGPDESAATCTIAAASRPRVCKNTHRGARTHYHKVKSFALCPLS